MTFPTFFTLICISFGPLKTFSKTFFTNIRWHPNLNFQIILVKKFWFFFFFFYHRRNVKMQNTFKRKGQKKKTKKHRTWTHLISTSERAFALEGTWTIWLLSLALTAARRASSFSGFSSSSSPKSTISRATLFFFNFFPIVSNAFLSYLTGLNTGQKIKG